MPRLMITHCTTYRYASAVALGPHRMILRPRETRDLRLVDFDLEVSPAATLVWSHDVAGNTVAEATFGRASDTLVIQSRAVVDHSSLVWPVFAITASAVSYPFRYSSEDWTDLGALAHPQYVDDAGRLSSWANGFVMGQSTDTLSLLKDVANGVSAQIFYRSRETEGTQGPLETLDSGSGSCRDFAVLLVEAVRTLGFGARLVSGYLFDPDGDRLGSTGSGSTHAWAEIFVPGAGWIAFDPTNRAMGSANLIPVAVARRIEQVSPVSGSFLGSGSDLLTLDVKVEVREV